MSEAITRAQLLDRLGRNRTKRVDVPEWGATVTIRELAVGEFTLLENAKRDAAGAAVKLLLAAMVEPRLEAGDAEAIRASGHAGVNRVVAEIMSLSGLGPAGKAAAEGN